MLRLLCIFLAFSAFMALTGCVSKFQLKCGEKILYKVECEVPPFGACSGYTVTKFVRQPGGQFSRVETTSLEDNEYRELEQTCEGASGGGVGILGILPTQSLVVGINPSASVAADFNNDGRNDLAVANQGSNNVSVMLRGVDNLLSNPGTFSVNAGPVEIVAGDFNDDDFDDLATLNNVNISILLSNGDGTFAPAATVAAGTGPFAIAAGKLNADDRDDLVVTTLISNNVNLLPLLPDAAGVFSAGTPVPASNANGLAIGLLDNDSNLDVVTSSQFFAGNGDGTLSAGQAIGGPAFASWVGLADLDDDGELDHVSLFAQKNVLAVRFGNGDGTFGDPEFRATGQDPEVASFINLGDSPGIDVMVSHATDDHVNLYYNTSGDGILSGVRQWPGVNDSDATPANVAAADFNSDTRPDIVLTDGFGENAVLFLGQAPVAGQPVFAPAVGLGQTGRGLAVGLFNGDSHYDIALAHGSGALSRLRILLGDGAGNFAAPINTNLADSDFLGEHLLAGHFNPGLDSHLDLALGNTQSGTVSILLGNGDGTFQPAADYTVGPNPTDLGFGLFDAGAETDLLVASKGPGLTGALHLLKGNANGSFQAPVALITNQNVLAVKAANLNNDAHLDFVAVVETSLFTWDVQVFAGNGDGTFGPPMTLARPAGFFPPERSLMTGDFDADGLIDIGAALDSGHVGIFRGTGSGSFNSAIPADSGSFPSAGIFLELTGDSYADLVIPAGLGISYYAGFLELVFADGFEP